MEVFAVLGELSGSGIDKGICREFGGTWYSGGKLLAFGRA